ncbi:SKG6 domain protein [Rhizoctonia solani 123E]|uniref:SKG6 domain protein n=1 Tax=Rhizoctonia solani 123E TaxID=1423351 RepID=A0A074RJ42_9AGAM|nr:SKG6 domain protein [Rhizoctonia solani 123E]
MRIHRTLGAALFLVLPIPLLAQSMQELGVQLTASALRINGAISEACRTDANCQTFANEVVPRCQRLQGDAGCWCGNHNPLHFCAICMSNPTDNQTTPDQMQAALGGHTDYHTACNAFETLLNASSTAIGTATSTATNAASTGSSDGGSKAPIGAIVGGVVGGVVALIIAILVFVLWRRNRRKEVVGPSDVSIFSGDRTSTLVNQQPRPYSGYSHPQGTFGHHDSSFGAPGYATATIPYQNGGLQSPGVNPNGLKSDGSYNKHPEPMTTPY